MIYRNMRNLHDLVSSRLYVTGYEHQLSHIKRCGELMLMDSSFKEQFLKNSKRTLKVASLDVNSADVRSLFIENIKSVDNPNLSEVGRLYLMYCQASKSYIPPTRNWHSKSLAFDQWRRLQISRCDRELGKTGLKLAHLPLAFELSSGCSVGCWFCGLSAAKLSGIFRYTDINAKLWKQCLHHMHTFLGENTEPPICYYATEPLDNPDLSFFLRDCYSEFHGVPQVTTAVATRNPEFSKRILKELRELQLTLHRFSITSIDEFYKVIETFTPEELLDVILMPRFPECSGTKLIGAGKAYSKSTKGLSTNTIACVSGFVVNMENKTVRLITPTLTCEQYPNGEIIIGIRKFIDADDLIQKVNELIGSIY